MMVFKKVPNIYPTTPANLQLVAVDWLPSEDFVGPGGNAAASVAASVVASVATITAAGLALHVTLHAALHAGMPL